MKERRADLLWGELARAETLPDHVTPAPSSDRSMPPFIVKPLRTEDPPLRPAPMTGTSPQLPKLVLRLYSTLVAKVAASFFSGIYSFTVTPVHCTKEITCERVGYFVEESSVVPCWVEWSTVSIQVFSFHSTNVRFSTLSNSESPAETAVRS